MDAKFSNGTKELLGKRGLKEADVADVVRSAESTKRKLVNKAGDNMAKKRIGEVTVYAVYDNAGNVKTAYSHRMQLGEVVKGETRPSDWVCPHCANEPAVMGTVNMTYMGVTRSGPAVVCPKCGDAWVEEYLATKTIAAAEGLFEKKRA